MGNFRAGMRISGRPRKLPSGRRGVRGGRRKVPAARGAARRAGRAAALRRACARRTARDSRPTATCSLAGHGSESCSLKPSAIWCRPPSRTFSSLARLRGMIASATRICRCGPITADAFATEFRAATAAGSRSPTTRAARFRSHRWRARGQSRDSERHSRICRLPLPCPERCAAGRDSRLPVRADSGQSLHYRPASRDGKCVDRWRRLGARLQARSSDRGDDGRVDSRKTASRMRSGGWRRFKANQARHPEPRFLPQRISATFPRSA